ncbi:MAG TPA: ABC transporter permease [Vicinamibacterales bacterium]
MWIFSGLFQAAVVTALNLRTIPRRLSSSAVAVIGMAGVVTVLVSVLSIAEGLRTTMANTGSPDTAIVMRAGSDAEMTSIMLRDDLVAVKDAPEIARTAAEGPLASAELFAVVDLIKTSTGTTANAPLRGVEPAAFKIRNFKMLKGRRFEPGRNEVIVGKAAAEEFRSLDVGSQLKLGPNVWMIVGTFDAGGTVPDSELWCDAGVLAPLYRRGNSRQAVYVRLQSPEAFTPFKDRLTTDPRVKLKVMREQEYYAGQSEMLSKTIVLIGSIIGLLMGMGALFVAVITMHSAVASRTREIATLRALGFRGGPVVISILVESMMLALVGGALGAIVSYVGFNGYQAATMNWQNMSSVAFAFRVTPRLLAFGIGWSLVLGLLSGLLPAIRAMRMPVVTALREL